MAGKRNQHLLQNAREGTRVDLPIRPKLYGELANWFHLVTAPADYTDEAAFYIRLILEASFKKPRTLLELGSGGGNNAFHLKRHLRCTLVDLSHKMLRLS